MEKVTLKGRERGEGGPYISCENLGRGGITLCSNFGKKQKLCQLLSSERRKGRKKSSDFLSYSETKKGK